MKSIVLAAVLAVLMSVTGCVSAIDYSSREALERMEPPQRAEYRKALDSVTEAVEQAKTTYDSLYDKDGNPLTPPAPAPTPEPTPAE